MRFLIALCLLVALVAAAPYGEFDSDEKTVITKDYYPDHLVIYEGKRDIVDIMVPLNAAVESDNSEGDSETLKKNMMIFFMEADIEGDRRKDESIYVYKNGKAAKVLDGGKAFTASADDSTYVFLGAKDGLYVYDPENESANKYGIFDYSIKDMAKENNNDILYILTDDRELYKVYDAATKKEKIDDVKDAEQIVMDYANNLFYYGNDKKPYVRTTDGEIKKIEGIPEGASEVRLFRPPLYNSEGAEFLVDNEMYTIYPDGKSEPANFEFKPDAKPTAYSMETAVFRYFGYNKKMYEYDFLSMTDSSESHKS